MFRTRCFLLLATFIVAGCTQPPAKTAPAQEKPKPEGDLAFTNLSKKAYQKLEIKTQKLVIEEQQERLPLTGWIMAKPGHEVMLTAPTAGYVHFKKGYQAPIAGDLVKEKDVLLELEPVLSPVEKIQVAALKRSIESDLSKAKTTLTAAETQHKRTEKLHKDKLNTDQDLEQAKKALDHAQEELKAAKDKLKYFETETITLTAPQAGTILQLHAGPGQYVPTAAPLVTIIDLDPVWVRVPVPEFDLPMVDLKANVEVTLKNPNHGRSDKPQFLTARPTGRVAQIDPLKHTADLWYEIEKSKDASYFVKDQMVTVKVPIGKKEKLPLVPYSAVVFDSHGHGWVYLERAEKDGKHQFQRWPVELVTGVKDGLMIRSNLKDGDMVVTNGAAILFSRDFFKTPVPEDD
jgi:membrane fusion protein, heavy metal efflux system